MTPMQTGEDRRALALAGAGVALRSAGEAQRFVGHAAVFDSRTAIGDPFTWGFYEEIAPGCFTDTLRDDDQRFLVDHSPYHVVSRRSAGTLEARQDGSGLAIDSALDTDLTYVSDLAVNVRNRNITGMSFGFFTVADEWRTEREHRDGRTHDVQVRRLLAARVPEVSAVTFPAYEASDAGLRAEDPVRAVGLALRERPDAAALFEARTRHQPELARYFERERVDVHRPGARDERPATGRRSWYRFERRDDGGAEGETNTDVLLYEAIGGFFGVWADEFVRDLSTIDSDHITLRINSPGGDVYDGLAIMNALHAHPARVTAVVEGLAASAASYIAMAGETVQMWANAEMMVHEAWGIAIGDSVEMHAMGDRLDRIGDNIASIYARRAGGTTEEWREIMRDETWYFASEALEAGLIDAVLEPPSREDDDAADERAAGIEADRQRSGRDRPDFRFAGRRGAPPPLTLRTQRRRPDTRSAADSPVARRMASLSTRFGSDCD